MLNNFQCTFCAAITIFCFSFSNPVRLTAEFLKQAPPDEVFETSEFDVQLYMYNVGSFSLEPPYLAKIDLTYDTSKAISVDPYPQEKNVLSNVSLNIAGGKMTSLVGHSGSGKSTILNLIPRFYDVQSGDILIDNQSIYKVKIISLRNKISLVSQDTTLFDDTIKNNIKYSIKASAIYAKIIE